MFEKENAYNAGRFSLKIGGISPSLNKNAFFYNNTKTRRHKETQRKNKTSVPLYLCVEFLGGTFQPYSLKSSRFAWLFME